MIIVGVTFQFDREQCDDNPELIPLRSPESVVSQFNDITIVCVDPDPGTELSQCVVSSIALSLSQEERLTYVGEIAQRFCHLPGYNYLGAEFEAGKEPPMQQYKCQCHFRSTVPHLELLAKFKEHIADGNLVGNGTQPQEYVAFVTLGAVSSDCLEEAVESLLARAFVTDAQNSADCFYPLKTIVL